MQTPNLKQLTTEEFQEELNKWFQDRGIIADLRSHLRHLMIAALQNTQIGLKPSYKTSPKNQALDLLVAEYLLAQNCHYTLSVFTSEVPTLKTFTEISPGALFRNRKNKNKLGGGAAQNKGCRYFKESEIEELLNALGMSSTGNQIKTISESYLLPESQESLLECFLKIIPELSAKLQIKQSLEMCHGDEKGVSQEWESNLTDLLMQSRLKANDLSSLQKSILRITENEISKIVKEENRKQMEVLVEREKRIQENIKKHDEELLGRLREAEEELKSRREIIDQELSERQLHLSKMALEWKDRHHEIMKISVNFHEVKSENQTLRTALEDVETENQELNLRLQAQNKIIKDLQGEKNLLISELKNSAEKKKDGAVKTDQEKILPQDKSPKIKTHTRSKSDPVAEKITLQIPSDDIISSDFSPLEEAVAEAWEKFHRLEIENDQIEKSYLEYKKKYSNVPSSESESSKMISPKKSPAVRKIPTPAKSPEKIKEVEKSPKITKKDPPKIEKIVKKESTRPLPPTPPPQIKLPTKRQSKDHSYFLRSRSMLENLEDLNLKSSASSTIESSLHYSSSNDSGSPSKKHVSFQSTKNIYESTLLTPLRTASFYCNEDKSKTDSGLQTFQEAEVEKIEKISEVIKSPVKISLRQQILMSDSDENSNLDLDEKSVKNSPKSDVSQGQISSGGNISVGKKSVSDEDFWA